MVFLVFSTTIAIYSSILLCTKLVRLMCRSASHVFAFACRHVTTAWELLPNWTVLRPHNFAHFVCLSSHALPRQTRWQFCNLHGITAIHCLRSNGHQSVTTGEQLSTQALCSCAASCLTGLPGSVAPQHHAHSSFSDTTSSIYLNEDRWNWWGKETPGRDNRVRTVSLPIVRYVLQTV